MEKYRKLGSFNFGNTVGETRINSIRESKARRKTLNQLHGSPEWSQRPSDGDHTLHPVGRQSGAHLDNGFAVNCVLSKMKDGTARW